MYNNNTNYLYKIATNKVDAKDTRQIFTEKKKKGILL
jgi:hypothetical protein